MKHTALDPEEPYGVAKDYVQSAYAIMTNPLRLQLSDDRGLLMGFHMLCGFAVELYLKAFLAHKGYSEEQLKRREIGHDLLRLRELCMSEGLYSSGMDFLAGTFGKHHKNFDYRYLKRETVYWVEDLRIIFSAFSSLNLLVDTAIGASSSRGKKPGDKWDFPTDRAWRLPRAETHP